MENHPTPENTPDNGSLVEMMTAKKEERSAALSTINNLRHVRIALYFTFLATGVLSALGFSNGASQLGFSSGAVSLISLLAASCIRLSRFTLRLDDLDNQIEVLRAFSELADPISKKWSRLFNATIGPASSQYEVILQQRIRSMDLVFFSSLIIAVALILYGCWHGFTLAAQANSAYPYLTTLSGVVLQIFNTLLNGLYAKNTDTLSGAQLRLQQQSRFLLAVVALDAELKPEQAKTLQQALTFEQQNVSAIAAPAAV